MAKPQPLPIWDRENRKLLQEYLDDHPSTYETKPQRSMTAWLESQPLYDWFVAALQNSRRSARKIQPFVKKHKIDMSEFEPMIYRSYAEFFTRRFRPGVRRFPSAPTEMGAFAEARYFGWDRSPLTRNSDQGILAEAGPNSRQLRALGVLPGRSRAPRPFVAGRLSPRPLFRQWPNTG
jgi:hypothetical protein